MLPKKNNNETWKPIKFTPCLHPQHGFPGMLYIPPGKSHTHTCPACGETITVTAPIIMC